jgi:RNA polymerase sigma factor (sigma-70 family)
MTLTERPNRSAARPPATARLLSDERLAARAAANDKRSFAEIYRRYGQDLYRFCLSIVGNPEDAGDALQSTMAKALKALPGEERQIRLRPWLYRVAHNESVELLRRRRETVELAGDLAAPGGGVAEVAAQRERLSQLLRDLAELPERQRSMLAMRELAGFEFEQIGEAFETSPAVVRQTIYEARLSLRQLAEGREMSCEEVTRRLSDADGRVRRRRDIQAHLRACPDCRAFAQAIEERRHDLASLSPLPAVASAGILHAALGSGNAAGGSAAGTAVAVGTGKVAASSVLAKSVATLAVAATVGVTAADRSGLVDAGLPGGSGDTASRRAVPEGAGNPALPAAAGAGAREGSRSHPGHISTRAPGRGKAAGTGAAGPSAPGTGNGPPASLPQASAHGQQAATEHRPQPRANGRRPESRGSRSKGSGRGRTPSHAKGGSGKPPKGSAAAGTTQPGGQKPQEPSTAPQKAPASGGPAEGPATAIGNKSSTGGIP